MSSGPAPIMTKDEKVVGLLLLAGAGAWAMSPKNIYLSQQINHIIKKTVQTSLVKRERVQRSDQADVDLFGFGGGGL
jgi:hypothetical protein